MPKRQLANKGVNHVEVRRELDPIDVRFVNQFAMMEIHLELGDLMHVYSRMFIYT